MMLAILNRAINSVTMSYVFGVQDAEMGCGGRVVMLFYFW